MESLRHRQRGFTLLELLVVIAIVAVMATVVVPALGRNPHADTREGAERLVRLVNLARQEAILTSRIWQLVLDPVDGGYRFSLRQGYEFVAAEEPPLAGRHALPALADGELEINGRAAGTDAGSILMFPTGEQDSFRVRLREDDREWLLAMDAIGPARVREE